MNIANLKKTSFLHNLQRHIHPSKQSNQTPSQLGAGCELPTSSTPTGFRTFVGCISWCFCQGLVRFFLSHPILFWENIPEVLGSEYLPIFWSHWNGWMLQICHIQSHVLLKLEPWKSNEPPFFIDWFMGFTPFSSQGLTIQQEFHHFLGNDFQGNQHGFFREHVGSLQGIH